MITLDFDTKNGNRVYVMEQATPSQQAVVGISVVVSFAILAGLMYGSMQFGKWLGKFINPTLGTGLGFLLMILALIVGGLAVAAAFQYIRTKILTCYGFLTIQKDNILEIHREWNSQAEKEVELKNYPYVNSTRTPEGYKIELMSGTNEKFDAISFLASYNNVTLLSQDAKTPKTIKTAQRHSHIRRPKPYPTDELFASWLKNDLIRDGQRVDFNRSVHIF